ncbi:hypothetical protein [Geothrix paludis]|uniref:hypothetical protein n=1 Tax=Geothrix paludis TaxID=2922722 RepID=UPI001FADFF8F|nr:hypothetical protein [Geothrix paludis]
MNHIFKAGFIVIAAMALDAAPKVKPGISIQRLQVSELQDGAISYAYFTDKPKGVGCEWATSPQIAAPSKVDPHQLAIRINGRLHHLQLSEGHSRNGPKSFDGTTYRLFREWSDNEVKIEIYENRIEENDSQRCTQGLLIVTIGEDSKRFPLWGLHGCE